MRARLIVERELFAKLLGELDPGILRKRLWALGVLGLKAESFVGDHRRLFVALGRLALGDAWISPERVAAEAGVDLQYASWITVAYADGPNLAALADALLDATRRSPVDSIGRTLVNAASDPAADLGRAIAVAIRSLRRLRGAA